MLRRPLIHKNKRQARAALYLSPLLLAGAVLAVTQIAGRLEPSMSWRGVDFSKNEPIQLLREYLEIDTSYKLVVKLLHHCLFGNCSLPFYLLP